VTDSQHPAGISVIASATISRYAGGREPDKARTGRPRAVLDQRIVMTNANVQRPKRVRERPEPKRYRADRPNIGKGTKTVCVSLPPEELAWLDRMAERCQTSRSHFIRQAVKHFGAYIFPDGKISRR
jgi:hypothetical protein